MEKWIFINDNTVRPTHKNIQDFPFYDPYPEAVERLHEFMLEEIRKAFLEQNRCRIEENITMPAPFPACVSSITMHITDDELKELISNGIDSSDP